MSPTEYFEQNKEQLLKDYFSFLSFPSISSEPEFKSHVRKCAEWLCAYLKNIGLDAELWETPGHPTVFAKKITDSTKPTLLIYNHYDVQPVDPLELWKSPPFEPALKDGQVFARGAQDNKGQCFYVMTAIKYLLETRGALPVNLKLCIEGEEECGSGGLLKILEGKRKELSADYLIVADLGTPAPNVPAIGLGVRGITSASFEFVGSKIDLHSGTHGGVAYNPLHALVEVLSRARDKNGKVSIPGFYDDVIEPSQAELELLDFSFDEKRYQQMFDGEPTGGEKQFSPWQRATIRPTFEINGISGGYGGEGSKTVIPGRARANITCRLVPNQDPQKINKLIINFLKDNLPPGIKLDIKKQSEGSMAFRADAQSKIVDAARKAYEESFATKSKLILFGGSIPVVPELAKTSAAETVLLGLGLPDDAIHAPNEHFGVDRLARGMGIIARIINLLG